MSYSQQKKHNPAKSRVDPVVNPYEQFTQQQFDNYVDGLSFKIREALDGKWKVRKKGAGENLSFQGGSLADFSFRRSAGESEGDVPATSAADSSEGEEYEGGWGPSKPTHVPGHVVMNGHGDEESPFVISDDDEDVPASQPVAEIPTHEVLDLDEEDSGEDTEGPTWEDEDQGPINSYDDIDCDPYEIQDVGKRNRCAHDHPASFYLQMKWKKRKNQWY